MSTNENQAKSNNQAGDAPTDSAEDTTDKAVASAQPLQTSVSRFAQQTQKNQENLTALIRQVSAQLRTTDAKVERSNAQIEKLGNWIRNNRH